MISIPLTFSHELVRHPTHWPVTRGVPMPEGTLRETDDLAVVGPDGDRVPAQFRVLARWTDGSVKWVLADFQAKADSSGTATYNLMDDSVDEAPAPRRPSTYNSTTYPSVRIEETEHELHVDTGVLRFKVDRHRYGLFHSVALNDGQHGESARAQQGPDTGVDARLGDARLNDGQRGEPADAEYGRERVRAGDAWARISEGASDGGWYAGYTDRGACAGHRWPATPMALP